MTTASSYSTLVQELYVAYFGRPADYFGLQNFEAALAAANAPTTVAGLEAAYSTNAAVKTLVDSFGTSAESTALYGSGTTESFVTAIFENLLNRAPAVAGLTFWVNEINSGAVTRGDAALAIAAGAAANSTAQGLIDQATINNKLTVASNFTNDLGASSLDITAYSGSAAATSARSLIAGVSSTTDTSAYQATVQSTITAMVGDHVNNTYTLTTGVDTIVGGPGNSLYNAVLDNAAGISAGGQAATLNSFDTITGGTLNNTLNITDFGLLGHMVLPAATITGMTTANVNSLEGIGSNSGNPFDFTTLGSLTSVNINASNGSDYVKVGNSTALSVVDTTGDNISIYTYGGSTVSVTDNTPVTSGNTNVYVTGGSATTAVTIAGNANSNYIYDLHNSANQGNIAGWTAGTNSITTVTFNNIDNEGTYSTIYSDALTTLNVSNSPSQQIFVNAAAGPRALSINLNNDVNFPANIDYPFSLYVQDSTATSVNVSAIAVASIGIEFGFDAAKSLNFNDSAGLSIFDGTKAGSANLYAPEALSLTLTGAGVFTSDLSGLNAAAVINATGSTGIVTVELASASSGGLTQSFTGGSGQDIVTVGAGQTGTVAGGSATDNEIVLDNIVGASIATLTPYTHFSVLGVAGTTSGVFDMSKAAGYKSFDVQGSGGDVTFTNAAAGSSISLEGGNSNIVTLQTIDTTGATDSISVHLGTATSTTDTSSYQQFTLEDSNFVGTATVNLVVNMAATSSFTSVSTLGDNNLVTLNISGVGNFGVTNAMTDVSTSLTINNTVAGSGTVQAIFNGLTDNYLTSLTFGGTSGTSISTLSSTSTSLTVTDNDSALALIAHLNDAALTTATFTNTVNTTAGILEIGHIVNVPALTSLNLNGNVAIHVAGDTVTSGITVAGTTDNANVTIDLSSAATAGGKTDTVALGNGNDTVHMGAGTGAGVATAESVNVAWQALAAGGTETISGISIHSTFDYDAATVAYLVNFGFGNFANPAVASSSSFSGVTIATSGAYTVSSVSGSTTILTATTAGATADPQLTATNTGGSAPTDTIVTLGTAGAAVSSIHSITLGTGSDTVTDLTAGSTTISIAGSASATDSVTANSAQVVHVTVGNGTDIISATAASASVSVVAGTGANAVTIGTGDTGTISFGTHTATDTVTLGASGTSLTAIVTLSGLNDSASSTDTVTFSGDSAATLVGFTQVTAGSVVGSGGNTTLLASWVAAADGATGSAVATAGATPGAAHGITCSSSRVTPTSSNR